MAELKTRPHDGDVAAFLNSVENDVRRRDALAVTDVMTRLSGEAPKMWGDSIVGFGEYPYKDRAGEEHMWMKIGLSPRKQSLTLYLMDGLDKHQPLLESLGPHSVGKACLYIRNLEKVDSAVLEDLIGRSLDSVNAAIERGFEGTLPN